jgi:hypothetical protein
VLQSWSVKDLRFSSVSGNTVYRWATTDCCFIRQTLQISLFEHAPYSQDKHVLNKAVETRVSTQRGEEFLGSGGLSPASCRGRPGSILNSPYGIWGRHSGTSTSFSPRTFVYWCDSSFHESLILHPLCQLKPTVLVWAASLKWQLNVRQFTEQTWKE